MLETITAAMSQALQTMGLDAAAKEQVSNVRALWEGHVGRHTGIYVPYSAAKVYYVGIATEGNTIHNRFQSHYAKFTVDLPALYGNTERARKETRWQFPMNWRKGIREEFLLNEGEIPNYWIGQQKKEIIAPANLNWRPRFKEGVDVDSIPVAIWNLDHLDPATIDSVETLLVQILHPMFNGAKTKSR